MLFLPQKRHEKQRGMSLSCYALDRSFCMRKREKDSCTIIIMMQTRVKINIKGENSQGEKKEEKEYRNQQEFTMIT